MGLWIRNAPDKRSIPKNRIGKPQNKTIEENNLSIQDNILSRKTPK